MRVSCNYIRYPDYIESGKGAYDIVSSGKGANEIVLGYMKQRYFSVSKQ